MSTGVSNAQLIDLTRTTLANLPKMEFEFALTYQNYIALNYWFAKDKKVVESGTSIERNIVLDDSGNAQFVNLYQKTPINVADVQRKITAPWTQVQSHWSIERREALRNRAPSAFVNLLESRRKDGLVSLANLLERRAWLAPVNSSDTLNPRGLPYWISKLVPAAGAGYNAALDVSGTFSGRRVLYSDGTQTLTDKAGIDPTAEAKWRNYAATYSTVGTGAGNSIRALRDAFYACQFQSPITLKDLSSGPLSDYRIYMNRATLIQHDELVQAQNVGSEKLGVDLGVFHGMSVFKRVPLIYAPALDTDTSNPIYGVNHGKFKPFVMEGDWMREGDPMSDVEQHNVFTTYIDGTLQYMCTNVREQFVLHLALAA